jgi:predicted RNA-binding protein YlxR (DUF448 family)
LDKAAASALSADAAGVAGPDTVRRCLVTGVVQPKDRLIRFVVGPENAIVPDIDERLGGRGLWVSADRAALEKAVARNAFARAARQQVQLAADLPGRVAALIERRCLDLLGMARRAGQVVAGFEKVDAALRKRRAGVLIEAADGAPDGRAKLRALASGLPVVSVLDSAALASALGRSGPVVHAVIEPGRLAQRFLREADRLSGLSKSTS